MSSKKINLLSGLIFCFVFGIVSMSARNAMAQEKLIIGDIFAPPLSMPNEKGMLHLLYKEAFSRVGMSVTFKKLPGARSLAMADSGKIDGDILRIAALDTKEKFPRLVQIPEITMNFDFVAFSKTKNMNVSGWNGLKPYSVSFLRGWQILHNNVKDVKKLGLANSADSMFKMLNINRVEIVIYERLQGFGIIKGLDLKGIYVNDPPLAVKPMHLYLNTKHIDKVDKLAAALKGMKKDGTYKKIVDETLAPFL